MFLESSLWGLFLTIAHFTSLNLKIGDTSATRDERDMVTWVSIGWALQKTEILSSKSPASSPWQSCFQSRSFASWADRGKQRLEIVPIVSVRLSTRVNLLHPLRKILLVPIKSSVRHYLGYGWGTVFQKTLAKGSTMLCCFVKQQIWVPLHFIMSLFCGI